MYFITTFHKCGSNWFRQIFRSVAEDQHGQYLPHSPNTGGINDPVKFGDGPIFNIFPGGHKNTLSGIAEETDFNNPKIVFCVRDPKDALVSQFYSWKYSHKNNNAEIRHYRKLFSTMSPVEGMNLLLTDNKLKFLNQLNCWIGELSAGGHILFRYEDLKSDFFKTMRTVLSELGLFLDEETLSQIKQDTAFSRKAKRKPGTEDRHSHYRKGIVGDHRNYFNQELTQLYEDSYGDIARLIGY